jgi:hypothetical protein
MDPCKALGLLALVWMSVVPAVLAADRPPGSAASTALVVTPIGPALAVEADDGRTHVEYDLLVVNAFAGDVALTSVEVTDPSGRALLRIDGDALAAAPQTLLDQKPVKAVPASGAAAVEVDLILPQGAAAPERLSHRIAYAVPAPSPLTSMIADRVVLGPDIAVDRRPPIVISAPLSGEGWAALNGCCFPNVHRSTRAGAATRIAQPETFAIDWMRIEDGRIYRGDGKQNEDYPSFGSPVRSVAAGEVVATGNDMPEEKPFEPPQAVKSAGDYGGNYV